MAETVLPYDRSIVPQETFFWCGPASSQVVLDSRGIHVSEQQLARELGTDEDGTDYVGLITPILNRHLGADLYVARYMENDPPYPSQVDQLWRDICDSIDAGFGVIANIVAPRSNYPQGVKGSASPAYSGGTVYHYIALMGVDRDAEAVWVADSGFRPFGYWIDFGQLASLIPPKGYAHVPGSPLWADILTQFVGPRR